MDGLWVDPEQGLAGYGERLLPLSAHEVALLAAFADAGDRVVTWTCPRSASWPTGVHRAEIDLASDGDGDGDCDGRRPLTAESVTTGASMAPPDDGA